MEPDQWRKNRSPLGLLLLRSVSPFGLAIEVEGVEAAYGFATDFRVSLPEAARITLTPSGSAPIFRKDTPSRVVHMTGEKFTNIDRLPQESGSMLEVTKALRMLKLEERAMVRRIREERDLALAMTKAKDDVVEELPEPKADPEPDPEPKA